MVKGKEYPIRVYFEDQGYNYVKGVGQLLFEGIPFKEATTFNEEGFAEVVTLSGEKHRIDKKGKIY